MVNRYVMIIVKQSKVAQRFKVSKFCINESGEINWTVTKFQELEPAPTKDFTETILSWNFMISSTSCIEKAYVFRISLFLLDIWLDIQPFCS